jgi:hypothetical protein
MDANNNINSNSNSNNNNNIFTTEIVRGLFGPNIAPIKSVYKCSHTRASGRLYISSNAICFYSNIFGFERKLMIRIMDITFAGLTRSTSIVIRSKCCGTTRSTGANAGADVRNGARHSTGDGTGTGTGTGAGTDNCTNTGGNDPDVDTSITTLSSPARSVNGSVRDSGRGAGRGAGDETNHSSYNKDILFEEEHVFKSFDEREAVLRVVLDLMEKRNNNNTNTNTNHKNDIMNMNRITTSEASISNNTTSNFTNRIFNGQQRQRQRLRTYSDPRDCDNTNVGTDATIFGILPNRARGGSTPNWKKTRDLFGTTTNTTSTATATDTDTGTITALSPDLTRRIEPAPYQSNKATSESVSTNTINVNTNTNTNTTSNTQAPLSTSTSTLDELKTNFKNSYPEVIIDSHIIPNYSLDEFYNQFLDDNAPCSMEVFQRNIIQDENIDLSVWTSLSTTSTNTNTNTNTTQLEQEKIHQQQYQKQKRSLSFLHPRRNAKLGPSKAQTTREQVCTRVSSLGIVLDMKTKFEKVPYSDCFIVEEGWMIESCGDGSGNSGDNSGCVKLSIRLNINFVKKTLMKKIIYNQTKEEVKDWFKSYLQYLLKSREGGVDLRTEDRNDVLVVEGVDEKKVEWSFSPVPALFVVIAILSFQDLSLPYVLILFISIILFHLHSLNERVRLLEGTIEELKTENLRIVQMMTRKNINIDVQN